MTDKQINKILRRDFSRIGWVLIIYYLLMNLLASGTMLYEAVAQHIQGFLKGNPEFRLDTDALFGNAWGYILTIAVGFAIFHAWKGSDYFRETVFRREAPVTLAALGCCLSLCIGAQMVNTLWITLLETILNAFGSSVLPVLEQVSGSSDTFSMFLYASFLAPVFEELLFRGYVLRSLQPYGKRFAMLCSAILFGLFHGNLLQTPYAVLVGLILGYVTVEYSIFWAIGIHMFNNLVLADLLSRATAQLPEMVVGMLNLILFGGFAVVSIVILIRNRYAVAAYQRSEWMDRRCLKCFFTNPGIVILTLIMLANMLLMFL